MGQNTSDATRDVGSGRLGPSQSARLNQNWSMYTVYNYRLVLILRVGFVLMDLQKSKQSRQSLHDDYIESSLYNFKYKAVGYLSIWRSKTKTNHERRRQCKQNSKYGSSKSSVGFGLTSVFFLIIFSKLTFNCCSSLQSLLQLLQFLFIFVSKEFYAVLFFFFAIFWFRKGYIFFESISLKGG